MNTKIVRLLDLILEYNGCVSLDKACSRLGFSRRMVFYYQKKLNDYLGDSQLPLTLISGGKIKVDIQDRQQFKQLLGKDMVMDYVFKSSERQDFILLMIGLGTGIITLEYLSECLEISRSTALADLYELKKSLSTQNIMLQTKPKKGYFLFGSELKIRYSLMSAYYNMGNQVVTDLKRNLLLKECSLRCNKTLDKGILRQINEIIFAGEKHTGRQFNYSSVSDTAQNLLLIYLRSFHAHADIDGGTFDSSIGKYPASFIAGSISHLGLVIPEEEIPYIQVLLMGARIYNLEDCSEDPQAEEFARELLSSFEKLSQIRLSSDVKLMQMFLLHIRSMFYRTKYLIKTSNSMDNIIEKTNNSFYQITKLAVKLGSRKYGLYIDDDEIAYLSLYFGSLGGFGKPDDNMTKPQILIVCNFGLGSSVYVRSQLDKILGSKYQYLITDVRNLKKSLTEKTVLVVSELNPYEINLEQEVPVITVSTVISEEQRNVLIDWMLKNSAEDDKADKLTEIVEIISRSAEIIDREKLIYDLKKCFPQEQIEKKLHLEDVFRPDYAVVCRNKVNCKEAMFIAGGPLIADNCIEPAYIENIIEVIETAGPYAECRDGVLLAHAKPADGVHRLSFGAALFKEPLFMGKWNKVIHVVFILAATDYESHAAPLVELISHLSQEEVYRNLTSCETADEFYRLVCLDNNI